MKKGLLMCLIFLSISKAVSFSSFFSYFHKEESENKVIENGIKNELKVTFSYYLNPRLTLKGKLTPFIILASYSSDEDKSTSKYIGLKEELEGEYAINSKSYLSLSLYLNNYVRILYGTSRYLGYSEESNILGLSFSLSHVIGKSLAKLTISKDLLTSESVSLYGVSVYPKHNFSLKSVIIVSLKKDLKLELYAKYSDYSKSDVVCTQALNSTVCLYQPSFFTFELGGGLEKEF